MAAKRRSVKSFPFTLTIEGDAGKEMVSFRLVFDFNALGLVEDKTGFSLLTGAIFSHLSANNVLTLFWAAVQANHPEYAGDEGRAILGSMIWHHNSGSVQDAVEEAFIQSLPPDQQARIREAVDKVKNKDKDGETPAEGGEVPLASPVVPAAQ